MRADIGTLITLSTVVAGCALPSAVPPPAEFLVSARDATYWIQSGTRGFHIRRSPLILARATGRFYELYVEEVDRSYADAVFTGERVFSRDLSTGDSALVFEDSAVIRRSAIFHRQHPGVPAIEPGDDAPDNVAYAVEGETDIISVVGPYVAIEHRLSIDRGSFASDDTSETVIDLRSRRPADVRHIASDPVAREAAGAPSVTGRRWHNNLYDIITRADTVRKGQAVILQDRRGREWRLGLVKSAFLQVYWLDKPKLDGEMRRALMRAFNEATSYGEPVQLANGRRPSVAPKTFPQIPVT